MEKLLPHSSRKATNLTLLDEAGLKVWRKKQAARVQHWLDLHEFSAKPGSVALLPDASGKLAQVVAGISAPPSLWDIAALPQKLPAGTYKFNWDGPLPYQEWLALGWQLGTYKFTRYKKPDSASKKTAQLMLPAGADVAKISRYAEAIGQARDLINTPAEDMGPQELADAVVATAKTYGAKVNVIVGNDLLKKNYPAIHTVGRASSRQPRLIDLTWGDPKAPRVTLVGKGVVFDTGGLDLKPSGAMYLMKKDMGGAAAALAIAQLVMDAKLPVRLRLLIPAVENSVSGNAFRPTDVITMRDGTTVEVGNTDAEGRLVLADALSEACSEKPAMLINFATLTGAARTALGTDLPALFCNDDTLATDILLQGKMMEDPLWRMPLHEGYKRLLESPVADLNSAPSTPYAGAITAALFLQHFVTKETPWAHIDMMAWNLSGKPGRPEGGEGMVVRAVFRTIEERFSRLEK